MALNKHNPFRAPAAKRGKRNLSVAQQRRLGSVVEGGAKEPVLPARRTRGASVTEPGV